MIYQVEGDILLSKAQAIAHGVRINDPMDKGLALALFNQYPGMHKDFHHWCHKHHPESGDAWLVVLMAYYAFINLITQEGLDSHDHRLGKATLTTVTHALRALVKVIEHEKINSLALPKLATEIGGLEWGDVWSLIDNHLGKLDIPVYLYTTYYANNQAQEPSA